MVTERRCRPRDKCLLHPHIEPVPPRTSGAGARGPGATIASADSNPIPGRDGISGAPCSEFSRSCPHASGRISAPPSRDPRGDYEPPNRAHPRCRCGCTGGARSRHDADPRTALRLTAGGDIQSMTKIRWQTARSPSRPSGIATIDNQPGSRSVFCLITRAPRREHDASNRGAASQVPITSKSGSCVTNSRRGGRRPCYGRALTTHRRRKRAQRSFPSKLAEPTKRFSRAACSERCCIRQTGKLGHC